MFITILSVILLQLLVKVSVKSTNLSTADNVRLVVVQDKMQKMLDGNSVDLVNSDERHFTFIDHGQTKIIEAYTNRSQQLYLRLKNHHGGYQPILGNLSSIKFKYLKSCISIDLVDMQNKSTEMYLTNVNYEKT